MEKQYEIAAIANNESVYLFNAIGVKTIVLEKKDDVERAIFQLVNKKVAFVVGMYKKSVATFADCNACMDVINHRVDDL